MPVVFETDAELAGDVDAGFVGEAHPGDERGGVAANEIRPFVTVHADAVAEAVGEVLVVGAVAGGSDDVASSFVDGLTLDAWVGCGQCGGLGLMHDVEYFAGLVKFGDGR